MTTREEGVIPERSWPAYFPWIAGVCVLGLLGWGLFEGVSFLIQRVRPAGPGDASIALSAGFVRPQAEAAVTNSPPGGTAAPGPAEPGSPTEQPMVPAATLPTAGTSESSEPGAAVASGTEGTPPKKELKKEVQRIPAVFEIRGSVQKDGKPIPQGKVRLTVSIVGERFRQSALTDLTQKGDFTVHNIPAFQTLTREHRIRVLAEVWPAAGPDVTNKEPLTETIYLNHPLPSWFRSSTGYGALGGLLLLLALFLWAFTGRSTYGKNRFAIILSYCVIFLSLAGSLVVPTLLMLAVPDLPEISGKVPVGLFVARMTADSKPQWMLNIGGYVETGDSSKNTPFLGTNGDNTGSGEENNLSTPVLRVVTLNGGIQIPLYVIILALIGGAINMTRQVPDFQSRQAIGSPSQPGNEGKKPDENERESSWRKGLLEQYMFLVAAPFLAIATYYLLILLGTIQPPIIVLVCFSIGLISDTVVTAITESAKKLLGGKQPAGQPAPAQPAPEPGTLPETPSTAPVEAPETNLEDKLKPKMAA